MNESVYLNLLNDAEQDLEIYKARSYKLSVVRLLLFTLFLTFLIIYLFNKQSLLLLSSLLFLGGFITFIIKHDQVIKKIKYLNLRIETIREYIYRFDQRWTSFKETGEEFNDDGLPFLHDLDIIGEASLFKYLNVCKTSGGKQKLVDRLSNPSVTQDELIARQQSMQEICNHLDFSLDFIVALKNYENEGASLNLGFLNTYLQTKIKLSKSTVFISLVITILSLTTFTMALLGTISWRYFTWLFVIQLLGSFIHHYRYKDVFRNIHPIAFTIVMLEKVYKVIDQESFKDEALNKLQSNIKRYGLGGINGINRIRAIESFNHFFLTYLLFNGLFSINLVIIYSFKKFIDRYGVHYTKSIEALEEFEVLTSLAILGQTKKNITLPVMSEEISINFTDLRHPLIPEDECVPNTYNHENHINIITGSNMSGKTSFLRMIGINLILMHAGAYCNATSFSSPYLKIFTSMRVRDDISKGISTFYAELLRIKAAIEYSEQHKPMILFIDEIFKGTNSNDRIQGAISLIEKLNKSHIIIFVSTHDFELCEIQSVKLNNYHFSEYYEGDQIKFDYKLKPGRCQTTNAKYLMKLAGIIRSE